MTLRDKVKQHTDIKTKIRKLYEEKSQVEKSIIEGLGNFDLKDETQTIDLDDIVEIAMIVKSEIDVDKVRELYPTVYLQGQRLYFDYKQAMLSFENPKDFWRIMSDCRKQTKTYELKEKSVNGYVRKVKRTTKRRDTKI